MQVESEIKDIIEEIVPADWAKKKPYINEVKRSLNAPKGSEDWFRACYENDKELLILQLTKFATGKRKLSTQSRLADMKLENLIGFALEAGFIV